MMRVGKFFLTAVVATVLLGAAGAGLSTAGPSGDAATSKKKAKAFVPKQFKGKWSGTWNNLTFDTTGKASMTLGLKGNRKKPVISVVFRLGGSAFGCPSPPPRKVKMRKGKGKNRWNNGGFKASYRNDQGPVSVTYKHAKSKISATGTSPCDKQVTYSLSGKMNNRLVKVTTRIFFNGEQFATSKTTMKKG